MDQSYLPFLYIVAQKMIPHFYVLGFGMGHWVLCNTYCTYGTSVVDRATLECLWEDQDTKEDPKDPKNWQVPEVDFLSN
jgi:hypothetical protein